MGPPEWKDIKRVQLMSSKQVEDAKKWEKEFDKRREELEVQKRLADQRRLRNSAKLVNMSARWRSLEHRRVQRSDLSLDRLRTSLSLTLRNEHLSTPGSESVR